MKDIQLPSPQITGGMPLMDALSKRASFRSFSPKELDKQQLSNLLWAAFGFRCEKRRTAPSSHNRQEIELYVCLPSGVYIYDAIDNVLRAHCEGDFRVATGSQDYVWTAPVNVIMVSDTAKIKGKTEQGIIETIYANTGFISENIYLFCTSEGLSSVTRAMIDKEQLSKILGLAPTQVITLIHTVGYAL